MNLTDPCKYHVKDEEKIVHPGRELIKLQDTFRKNCLSLHRLTFRNCVCHPK